MPLQFSVCRRSVHTSVSGFMNGFTDLFRSMDFAVANNFKNIVFFNPARSKYFADLKNSTAF
jgi:hypothetical protein